MGAKSSVYTVLFVDARSVVLLHLDAMTNAESSIPLVPTRLRIKMTIKFYKSNDEKWITIGPPKDIEKSSTHIWMQREDGEGGDFNFGEICDVIYGSLDKYFKENF